MKTRLGLLIVACLSVAAILAPALAAARGARRHRAPARPAAPAHTETWAFDDGCNGGAGADATTVRGWVNYAESNCGPGASKARSDCHVGRRVICRVMQYLDTDWDFSADRTRLASAASSSWWLHSPSPNSGSGIFSATLGGGTLINQANPAVRSFFRLYARQNFNADDGLLMDWQSPSLAQELYYSTCGCTTTSEIRSDSALRSAHEAMAAALTHDNGRPFMQADNSLPPNPNLPQGFDMLNQQTGVDAWVAESEPWSAGTLDPFYSTLLDQIAHITTRTRAYVVLMSAGVASDPTQAQGRRVQEATILLGYQPGRVVDWANLERDTANLAVWPEEGIYPTHPIESMRAPRGRGCLAGTGAVCTRGGHRDVQVAPGVYRREFGACYRNGSPFGRCAAIINTTSRWLVVQRRWLRRSYHHEITLVGGDVQTHGTIDLTGAPFAAGATTIAPEDALLLAR